MQKCGEFDGLALYHVNRIHCKGAVSMMQSGRSCTVREITLDREYRVAPPERWDTETRPRSRKPPQTVLSSAVCRPGPGNLPLRLLFGTRPRLRYAAHGTERLELHGRRTGAGADL